MSHSDNDHDSDASTLISAFPEMTLITDIPEHDGIDYRSKIILLENLMIEIMAPKLPENVNNDSCVVKVNYDYHQVLLMGDIVSTTEQALLTLEDEISSDVLVSQHQTL